MAVVRSPTVSWDGLLRHRNVGLLFGRERGGGFIAAAEIPTQTDSSMFRPSAKKHVGWAGAAPLTPNAHPRTTTLTSLVPGPIPAGSDAEEKKGGFRIPEPWCLCLGPWCPWDEERLKVGRGADSSAAKRRPRPGLSAGAETGDCVSPSGTHLQTFGRRGIGRASSRFT